MEERKLNIQNIDSLTKKCVFGSVGGRPEVGFCPNDPITRPENHRPKGCEDCTSNPEAWKMASHPLPDIYIIKKQREFLGSQTIIFSPSMIVKKSAPTIEDFEMIESPDNI